jgi:hypothetical protein
MSIQKRKERKKKLRKEISKTRVLKRRTAIRQKRQIEQSERLKEAEMQELMHGKINPIVTNPEKLALIEEARQRKAMEKLEQNLKVLEALEQEYEAEQSMRRNINETLEGEGHATLKEKMDALHEKALEATGKTEEFKKVQESRQD